MKTCVRCGDPKKYHPGGKKGPCMRCSKCSGFVDVGPVYIGNTDNVQLFNYRAPGAPDGDINTWSRETLIEKGLLDPNTPLPPRVT